LVYERKPACNIGSDAGRRARRIALTLFKVPLVLNSIITALQQATQEDTSFLPGKLPFEEKPGSSAFILAFQALPMILVISVLSALLYYWRTLPTIVRCFA